MLLDFINKASILVQVEWCRLANKLSYFCLDR